MVYCWPGFDKAVDVLRWAGGQAVRSLTRRLLLRGC